MRKLSANPFHIEKSVLCVCGDSDETYSKAMQENFPFAFSLSSLAEAFSSMNGEKEIKLCFLCGEERKNQIQIFLWIIFQCWLLSTVLCKVS